MKLTDLPEVDRILAREYRTHKAPIVDLVRATTRDPFKILVATILSARTKDDTTAAACKRLFAQVGTPAQLRATPVGMLEKLIFPVGFYHTKAKHLKQLPDALHKLFADKIPNTVEELCELPGVGRKTANLVVAQAFGKPAVCVDVHVHRISNRLGLIRTATPFDSEMSLRRTLPVKYWNTWNSHLVSFGQTICTPVSPRCSECPIRSYCKRIGVKTSR